jgi:putative phosphoribosyl transferase
MERIVFRDRREAGQQLAAALQRYAGRSGGLILAIPRGGVVVGLEVSLALRLPLDVLITRKLGAPDNPELALGALAETGFVYLNEDLLLAYPSLATAIEPQRVEQEQEITRRRQLYRAGRMLPSLRGRTVILVDDGVATGATFLASIQTLKASDVGHLVAALPVAPAETVRLIGDRVDECVVVDSPYPFYAVGQHYADFSQVTDQQAAECLGKAWRPGL